MAHGTIEFFNPSCPITVGGDWDFQTCGPKQYSENYANELGSDGDELRHATHGKRTEWSWTFVNNLDTGTISIPKGGLVSSGWHIDSIQIVWGRDQIKPKMTVNAHMHSDGTNHTTGSCRTYSATVSIAAVAFGVPADLGGVALANGAVVDFRSATYTLKVTHIDEPARDGTQLAGQNHDGVETLALDFTGYATMDDYTIASGWTRPGQDTSYSNTGATTTTINILKHIAHDSPAAAVAAPLNAAAPGNASTTDGDATPDGTTTSDVTAAPDDNR